MKVCVTTTAFPRWAGDGQGGFIWGAVRAIVNQGVQVRVVAMHSPGSATHEWMDGIEVIRPRYWWPERWEMLRKAGSAGLPATWRQYPAARVEMFPFILAHTLMTARCAASCDLVHAQWTLSAGVACLGRSYHHRPVLATVQGSDVFQVPQLPLGTWLTRRTLRGCEHITALSQSLRDAVLSFGIDEKRVSVIPNGVDTKQFTPVYVAERQNVILYVGTLIERKGLKYLLSAMPEILRALPNYRLVIVGDGPQKAQLLQMAGELGIQDKVHFAGFQPPDQVRKYMQRAKVLVLPSLEEGLGVVLLEALACGTPVVGSEVGGIQDVITPCVGAVVPPADRGELCKAIQSVVVDQARWEELSGCARERAVSEYDWAQIAARFVSLYRLMV